MPSNPLAEVFGYPVGNFSDNASRHRKARFCPFHNSTGPCCTKNSIKDPLGVCSIAESGKPPVITCPVRFREDWKIVTDAAAFFFPENAEYLSLSEVRLPDRHGKSAGNIDVVLALLDKHGRIQDFGALEIQAVYITGNISGAFRYYMEDPKKRCEMDWPLLNYPRPDYLSSSRKRLAPQLLYKGGILHAWKRKMAVAVQQSFFATLPLLPEVEPSQADIAWMIYDLVHNPSDNRYQLQLVKTVYTQFKPALERITTAEVGKVEDFLETLQHRIDRGEQLGKKEAMKFPPDIETIDSSSGI
ncbi:MAG: hypothetical protein IPM61_06620 [Chlorobi bacterium]|nr:MAG: Restriction endonuclease NotI [Chlorobi bacterium OLB7]MBK8910986.1 hypothetical protein [Chlorobiota bacterium]MBX7216732.1 hypothetical protein [Candidatus Kapabacteria bacterium]